MNSIVKTIGVAALTLTATTASAFDTLYVRQVSGDTAIALSEVTEIQFLDEGVAVTTTQGTQSFDYSTFCSLRFDQNHTGGVEALKGDAGYSIDGNRVTIAGAAEVSVVATDGRTVLTARGSEADLQTLPTGLYLVKGGCVAVKFVKK